MDAEDLVINDDAQCQEVEHVCEVVPDIGVSIFTRTLGIEPVRLCYAPRFMVTSYKVHTRGISQFETDEKGYGFDAEEATIDIVTWVENQQMSACGPENCKSKSKSYHTA